MFKNRTLILLPFLILILLFYGCQKNQETTKESIKVVAIMSLSGEAKMFGESSRNALELLSKEFSKKGIEITYLDDENNKEKVEDSIKKLIVKEKIKAIILCTQDVSAEAVAKIAADNQIIVINATDNDILLSKNGKGFIYSLCYSNEFEAKVLAQFAYEKLKISKVAILFNEEEQYSKNLADYFKVDFEKLGGKVTILSSYKNGTVDYSETLKKLPNSEFDLLFLPEYYYKLYGLAKQIRTSGINAILMGGDGWDCDELLPLNEFQGAYFSSQFIAKDSIPGTIEFKKTYEEIFKTVPNARAALTYDAGKLLISILDNSSKHDNSDKIKEDLEKATLEGVSGNISFSQDKRAKKNSYIVQIKDNSLQIINKVSPE